MTCINDINVIFLDAGGVLFETFIKEKERIKHILMERGYQESFIDKAIHKANQYKQNFWDLGKFITNWKEEEEFYKTYYNEIAKELGDVELTNELFYFAHYGIHCKLFPEVKDALDLLSKKYRLGIISNALPSMDWVFDWLGIRKYFESMTLSAFAHAAKPHEAIYRIALEQMNATGKECVFIDDLIENTEAAERLGIKGYHLDRNHVNLIELLRGQGII